MDSVAFLKFWKIAACPTTTNAIISSADEQEQQKEEEEEEDSFFDLELLSVSAVEAQRPKIPTKLGDHINLCSRDLQTDSISKRKILPIEPSASPKPQSPIQLLKSAPKFPVFIFKKQKSMAKNRAAAKAEPASEEQEEEEEESRVPSSKLARDNSTRRIGGIFPADPSPAPARRFSKETVQKYLKLIKPKALKKPAGNDLSPAAAADSPMREKQENSFPAGIRLVCKHLGKSKSASSSAAGGGLAAPPPNRRDDSLLQQHDGIQSAILHCKRSFNSSTEHHPLFLSRTETATASQERSRSLSCKDFCFKESKEEEI